MESSTLDNNSQIKYAYNVIDTILRSNEEDNVNELFPDWHRLLVKAKDVLTKFEIDSRSGKTYIRYADILLDTMTPIVPHPLILD